MRRLLRNVVAVFVLSGLTACVGLNSPLHPQTAQSSGVLSEMQALYDVQHYQLELQVYPDRKIIEGRVTMRA
ncbi:MAG: M1 family peptidase, partial [Gammaproteobacteria bacterium]